MKKLKILEVCPFSSGTCGVFTRVVTESVLFTKLGHKVMIVSSNATKGSDELDIDKDKIWDVPIRRYPFRKLGGESFMKFNYSKDALRWKPDIIIAHNYRHLHTTQALAIAKKLKREGHNCKVILVTHAPFIEGNVTRSKLASFAVWFYDKFKGPGILKKFDKVVQICKWESDYLDKLKVPKEKRVIIPNAIHTQFFSQPDIPSKPGSVLFLGRVAPIKDIETLIKAAILLPQHQFSIVGPKEEEYYKSLILNGIPKNVKFYKPIYDLDKKIKVIDRHEIFVLPSLREANPQALLEAMSRGRVVIAAKSLGTSEIIDNLKDGFLFPVGDFKLLAKLIKLEEEPGMRMNACTKAYEYRNMKLLKSYTDLFKELLNGDYS